MDKIAREGEIPLDFADDLVESAVNGSFLRYYKSNRSFFGTPNIFDCILMLEEKKEEFSEKILERRIKRESIKEIASNLKALRDRKQPDQLL